MGIFCTRIDGSNYNKNMLKLRSDTFWSKWLSSWFLEDDRYDIIPYMSFPQQLLPVISGKRQQSRNVKHDFAVLIFCENRIQSRRISCKEKKKCVRFLSNLKSFKASFNCNKSNIYFCCLIRLDICRSLLNELSVR